MTVETELKPLLKDYFDVFTSFAYIDTEMGDDSESSDWASNTFRLYAELTSNTGSTYR